MGTDIHIAVEIWQGDRWHLSDFQPCTDRNYWSFAVLADVRNGYGFAGADTGEPVQPIDEPRGLPPDISPELQHKLQVGLTSDDEEDLFYLGDYGFSWVTLRELLDYDLDAPMLSTGYVSAEQAQHFRDTGEFPRSFCAWTPQPGFEKISWVQPIRDRTPLIQTLIEELTPLGAPENVRIVFGFDS